MTILHITPTVSKNFLIRNSRNQTENKYNFLKKLLLTSAFINVYFFLNIDVADSQISVNQSYQQNYSNSSSLEFKNFSETFCTEVGTDFLFMQ